MRSPSTLEKKFTLLWKTNNGDIPLVSEHRFHQVRKWRIDFAHTETKTGIEVEGGHWSGGRHTRGAGFEADCEKYNTALLMGWTIYRLTGKMLTGPWVKAIGGAIRKSEPCSKNVRPGSDALSD
jgi:very-short-patch-repair endonuclease